MGKNPLDQRRIFDARDHGKPPAAAPAALDLDREQQTPYLALVREKQNSLDYLMATSRSDYYQVEVRGTTHLDFTDDTLVLPVLKWLGVTGAIGAGRVIEITNEVSLQFFDAYLRDGPKPRFNVLPELSVATNDYARE